MPTLSATELDKRATHFLMTSGIVPRPIAWVGTQDREGRRNLAPFSYYMGVSAAPPRIAISVARARKGRLKDTAQNILATRVFSVSLVTRGLAEQMVQTAASVPHDTNEFAVAKLAACVCDDVAAPRVVASPFAMECRLHQAIDLESTHLLIGEVVRFHIADEAWANGRVDLEQVVPVGRLGVGSEGSGQYISVTADQMFSL